MYTYIGLARYNIHILHIYLKPDTFVIYKIRMKSLHKCMHTGIKNETCISKLQRVHI